MPEIKAHWNCDHTYVVWRYEEAIPECRGFALHRKDEHDREYVTNTWVGFRGQVADAGTMHPSTVWPIQRYMWADLEVSLGQTWRYRAVPMVGPAVDLHPDEGQATDWSEPVTVVASDNHHMSAFFNRGTVAAQWLARKLGEDHSLTPRAALEKIIATTGDRTRDFLSGQLRLALLGLLHDVRDSDRTLYACLFELDDPELIEALRQIGKRARVILANGTRKGPEGDENHDVREDLKDDIQIHDRLLDSGLSHNKFVVVCDASGRTPERVWTGSTNWTMSGLCTQANNGLVIESEQVGRVFLGQWHMIEESGNEFTTELRTVNGEPKPATVDGIDVTTWFTPVPQRADDRELVDLRAAKELIDGATEGILFLMFSPGRDDTLLSYIVERGREGHPTYDPSLYIHGVLNTDLGQVDLFRRGERQSVSNFDVVMPATLDGRFDYWQDEIGKLSVMVHSKVVVIDPFTDNPIVMTGSHNLGHQASEHNDDNLVIARGSNGLAAAYAVNVIGVYTQYRWRYLRKQAETEGGGEGRFARDWHGLQDDARWQADLLSGARLRELRFWLGEPVAAPLPER
jgi:phosphatidylserine/phosphatidylglycerophosphate/cardiolipin synthase-like enzyme